MKKRAFAMLLALALTVGLCPSVMAAGKLSTPTELAWGEEFGLTDQIFWNFGENTAGIIRIVIYKDDHLLTQTEIDYEEELSNTLMSDHLSYLLVEAGLPMESGVYQFTVQNIAALNADSDNDSAVAVSSKWTYTAPAAHVAPPTDLAWDFPYHTWRRGTDAELQDALLLLYFCQSENGDYKWVSTSQCYVGGDSVRLPTDTWALEEYGAGYYRFRVLNLSDDVTQTQHSPLSPYSEPYHHSGGPVDICPHEFTLLQGQKNATCTEDGYTGDYVCANCHEVMTYGDVIPAKGHDLDADGLCARCGQRLEYRGALGQLSWVYTPADRLLTFHGVIPAGETVFVARYQDGRFTGVKAATGNSPTVEVDTAPDRLRLFWLDGSHAPKCPAVECTLAK